jgi:hypothetical protein
MTKYQGAKMEESKQKAEAAKTGPSGMGYRSIQFF